LEQDYQFEETTTGVGDGLEDAQSRAVDAEKRDLVAEDMARTRTSPRLAGQGQGQAQGQGRQAQAQALEDAQSRALAEEKRASKAEGQKLTLPKESTDLRQKLATLEARGDQGQGYGHGQGHGQRQGLEDAHSRVLAAEKENTDLSQRLAALEARGHQGQGYGHGQGHRQGLEDAQSRALAAEKESTDLRQQLAALEALVRGGQGMQSKHRGSRRSRSRSTSRRSSKPRRSHSRSGRRSRSRSARSTKSRSRLGGSWAWVSIPSILFLIVILVVPSFLPACLPAIEHFHGQLPETIRTCVPFPLIQDTIGLWVNTTSTSTSPSPTSPSPSPINGIMEVPTGPNKDELGAVRKFEQDKHMTNVESLKTCEAWTDVDAPHYDEKVEILGEIMKLPEAMKEQLKSAKFSTKEVKALEKFALSTSGRFYFGKFTTKRRQNGNMDLAIALYGFSWSLADHANKSYYSGEHLLLQSMTPEEKDLCLKSWRSLAVEAFEEMCEHELLQFRKRTVSSLNKEEEEKIKQYDQLGKSFMENGKTQHL